MAFAGKTNWQLNEIVKPGDMNRIEQGILTLEAEKIAKNAIEVLGNEDLNNCIITGIYTWSIASARTIANRPESVQGTMLVLPRVTNYSSNPQNLTQLVITQQNNIYTRILADGVWSAWSKVARTADVEPVGTIFAFAGNNIPTGYLPCNGSAISRTTYANLFAVIGTTYGAGNGSTTFNLPNLNNGSFLEGSNTVGTVKSASASVPDHYHAFGYNNTNNGGRFIATNETKTYYLPNNVGFRAWNGSGGGGRYESNTATAAQANMVTSLPTTDTRVTVQPKSVTVKFCIKY